ncbi:hypothetical protein AC249_AIPGENE15209 [Exaiptasia diaphana]|nr:hypothetical protein AC249_AIPGENE15209 [Exaiptasia diaphana]
MDEMSESDPELPAEELDGGNDNKSAEEGEIREPPKKKPKKELTGVLADMAKMVNEPLQNGDLDSDLSDLLTELLSKGAGKDQREELINKLPTPGNCKRLDVVRVNTEIFNNVSKDVKTEDVMLQKAQKSLIKGITGVANVLTQFIRSEKDDKTPTEMAGLMRKAMGSLSDSLSLLSDASHEIDLRRRNNFKTEMKADYRLLCSDQNPVKDLLFGTELSKSVKDLSEASKQSMKCLLKDMKDSSNIRGQEPSRVFVFPPVMRIDIVE